MPHGPGLAGVHDQAAAREASARARPATADASRAWRQTRRSYTSAAKAIVEHVGDLLDRFASAFAVRH